MSVHVITVTIAAGTAPTPFIQKGVQPANSLCAQTMIISYAGTGTVYVGDANVSATNGIPLTSSSAPLQLASHLTDNNDLYAWYVSGTGGQKLTVLYLD